MIVGGAVAVMTIERCPRRHQSEMNWVEWLQESQWYAMKLVLGNIMNVPVIDTSLIFHMSSSTHGPEHVPASY